MSLRERSLRRCGFWMLSLLSCIDPEGNFASLWFVSLLLSFLVLTCNWEEAMGVRKGEEGSTRKRRDFFLRWRRTDISLQKGKNTSVPPQFLNTSKFITEKECLWLSGSLSTQAPMNSGHCEMCPGSRNFVFPVGKGEMPAGKILLVEDTEINRILLRKVFRDLNLLFEEAENGQIAVDYFKQGKNYDLVLMDKEMPVMDGHEATRQLRLLGVKTPIIALTGNSLQSDKEMFFQAGANEFRTKPLSRDELMWLLARYGLECRQPSSMLQP